MSINDPDGITHSVDTDQTAPSVDSSISFLTKKNAFIVNPHFSNFNLGDM